MLNYINARQVKESFAPSSWQRLVFDDFEKTMLDEEKKFPCIFGIAGLKSNQIRFLFIETITPEALAAPLASYLKNSRDFGANTSLAVFSKPKPIENIHAYRHNFWNILYGLSRMDECEWPSQIPEDLDTPEWEFCFAKEPVFVVCNTPAHVLRKSRRSMSFMMTFQPRWIFNSILGTEEAAESALAKVRTRLMAYDVLPPSPHLGLYGDPDNREYAQYFLEDNNAAPQCPFHSLSKLTSKGKAA